MLRQIKMRERIVKSSQTKDRFVSLKLNDGSTTLVS